MSASGPSGNPINAWLQLLRPANVVTALADVLAGAAVAGPVLPWRLAVLLPATMALYAGGIVLNDFFDRHIDAVERPERPIPSGKISPASARNLGFGLLAAGVLLAALAGPATGMVAAFVALVVVAYDARAKRHPVLGPITMGLCRALNLLLGVALVPASLVSARGLGLLPLVYIAAVTLVSRGEVHGSARGIARLALALVAGVMVALALLALGPRSIPILALALTALLASRVLPAFWRAARTPDPPTLRRAVRTGVLSLVLVNAVIASAYAGIIYCLAILATGLVAARLARLFAVT